MRNEPLSFNFTEREEHRRDKEESPIGLYLLGTTGEVSTKSGMPVGFDDYTSINTIEELNDKLKEIDADGNSEVKYNSVCAVAYLHKIRCEDKIRWFYEKYAYKFAKEHIKNRVEEVQTYLDKANDANECLDLYIKGILIEDDILEKVLRDIKMENKTKRLDLNNL